MDTETTDFASLRFSTSNLPERDWLPFWREVFARKLVQVDMEPLSDLPLQAEAALFSVGELRAMWANVSAPARYRRTSQIVSEGDDSFGLVVNQGGRQTMSQRGVDVSLAVGDAIGCLQAEPATMIISQVSWLALAVPRAALVPLVGNVESAAMRLVPQGNEALRLLVRYLEILREGPAPTTPESRHFTVTHIHDLIAVALGATRDGAAVALRQRVTPRYIHMLFETEGITFSEFVLSRRLMRAHHGSRNSDLLAER